MNEVFSHRTDEEYLAGELLENAEFIFQHDLIKISLPSTCYIHHRRPTLYNQDQLLGQYRRIYSLAKDKNCHIAYRKHIRRRLKECMAEYWTLSRQRDQRFDRLLEQGHLVERRGLHCGTSDDRELKKLQDMAQEIFGYRPENAVIREVESIAQTLHETEERLSRTQASEGASVWIFL